MAAKTLTSTNCILTLTVAGLFPSGVQLQGFATDKAWATAAIKRAETQMGVDGILSAGYTPAPAVQTISFQADSKSKAVIAAIDGAMQTSHEVVECSAVLAIPSTQETFTMPRGFLTSWQPIPDGQKLLQSQDAEFTWETVQRAAT